MDLLILGDKLSDLSLAQFPCKLKSLYFITDFNQYNNIWPHEMRSHFIRWAVVEMFKKALVSCVLYSEDSFKVTLLEKKQTRLSIIPPTFVSKINVALKSIL